MKLPDTNILVHAVNMDSPEHTMALAIEHGATLTSFDRDFTRFKELHFERLQT